MTYGVEEWNRLDALFLFLTVLLKDGEEDLAGTCSTDYELKEQIRRQNRRLLAEMGHL